MPVGCSKLYMCNIIPKATVQKVVKCQASQNGIIKKCLNNPKGGRKWAIKEWKKDKKI